MMVMSIILTYLVVQLQCIVFFRLMYKSYELYLPLIFVWTPFIFLLSILVGYYSYGIMYFNGGNIDYIIDYDRHHMDLVYYSSLWFSGSIKWPTILGIIGSKYGFIRFIMSVFYAVFGTEPIKHLIINFASTYALLYFVTGTYSNLGYTLKRKNIYVLLIFPFFLVQSVLFRDLFTGACFMGYLFFATGGSSKKRLLSLVFALVSVASRFVHLLFIAVSFQIRRSLWILLIAMFIVVIFRDFISDNIASISSNEDLSVSSFSFGEFLDLKFILQRIVGPFPWTQLTRAVNKNIIWQDMLHGSVQLSVLGLLIFRIVMHPLSQVEKYFVRLWMVGIVILFLTPDVHLVYNLVPTLIVMPLFKPALFLRVFVFSSALLFVLSLLY